IDFGLSHPALFELMFTASELHTSDPELVTAQQRAIDALRTAVDTLADGDEVPPSQTPHLAMISWAFVHGVTVLARGGALQAAAPLPAPNGEDLIHTLTDLFAHVIGRDAAETSQSRQ
ncbi:MAG: WHG domain-containing protein, partial [Mycobacterium sp.]|nr:WHG domain-containing protein [Mycobacterium sp.]